MDILRTAIDWAKAEVLSSTIFILFGLVFLVASYSFWHSGKTDVAKAYVFPMLIGGSLLLILGIGLFIQSYNNVSIFAESYSADSDKFVVSQLENANRVERNYQFAVFRIMPLAIVVSAILFPLLTSPHWRASLLTTIAMLAVLMLIDTNANARLEDYKQKLVDTVQSKQTRSE